MRHRGILVEGDANLPGASSISCNVAGSFVRPRWAVLIANGLLAFGPSNRATLNDDRSVANRIIWIMHACQTHGTARGQQSAHHPRQQFLRQDRCKMHLLSSGLASRAGGFSFLLLQFGILQETTANNILQIASFGSCLARDASYVLQFASAAWCFARSSVQLRPIQVPPRKSKHRKIKANDDTHTRGPS